MTNLVLNILYQYLEHGDKIRFTKNEIDKLIKDNDVVKNNDNELGNILLWENGYLSSENLAKSLKLEYEDKNFYLIIDDFSDILNEKDYSYEIDILNNEYEYDYSCDYKPDIDWSNFTTQTISAIIDYLIEKKVEIDTFDNSIVITEDNSKPDGDIKIDDEWISIEELIDEDGLEELKSILENAICEAQHHADIDKIETQLINSFESNIGVYQRVDRKRKYWDKESGSQKEKDVEVIRIKLDIDWDDIKTFLKETYEWRGTIDFEEEKYGDYLEIMNEFSDGFEIDTPDYNYVYGTIDNDYLNESIRDRLLW